MTHRQRIKKRRLYVKRLRETVGFLHINSLRNSEWNRQRALQILKNKYP